MNEIAPTDSRPPADGNSSPTKVFLLVCGAIVAVVLLSAVLARSVLPAEPPVGF